MRRLNNPIKDLGYLGYRWTSPFVDILRIKSSLTNFFAYFEDLIMYSKMDGAEKVGIIDTYPIFSDRTSSTPFDSHYFYQDIWAARRIYSSSVRSHIDVGSNVEFVGFLTAFTKIKFVDIRPLGARLDNFQSLKGSVLKLPFKSNSVRSLSCLHVAEHVGLGRYGDSLDPAGTIKACRELSRVLAPGGNLYFSLPVGKPRLCFNAHRIHSPKQILKYFENLKLKEFSGINDRGQFLENADINNFESQNYACGLFVFTKK